ncbi:MAG: RecX family transcriptional regulator [Lachnospiraceae bacterium]|nr:RecX family transcriptional regulator [Lachnospiraceae bacterium]
MIKKHYDPERADDRERSRVFRFLLGRGFSLSDVKSALKF